MINQRRVNGFLLLPLCCLLLSACGGGGGGDTITSDGTDVTISALKFSDPSLATCVQAEADRNGWTNPIQVTSLDCKDSGIRLIGGIESLINLTSLNLSGNPVDDLTQLASLVKLKTVNLSSMPNTRGFDALFLLNDLTDVNLSGSNNSELTCAELDSLSSSGALVTRPDDCNVRFTDIVFTDVKLQACVMASANENELVYTSEVTQLGCVKSGITQLGDLANFQNLQSINISGNMVSDLTPLSFLPKLIVIDASDNPIADISPLGASSALQSLNISHIPALQSIDALLSLNTLKELNLEGTGEDQQLSCATLDQLSSQLDSLNHPRVCNKLITDVVFADAALGNCVKTQATALNITMTSEFKFIIFPECTGLGITSLEGMENFGNLQNLILSNNAIEDLSPLGSLIHLSGLNVDSNKIKNFYPLYLLKDLHSVDASANPDIDNISTLVYMTEMAAVNLTGSGIAGKISCDDLNALQSTLTNLYRPATCDAGATKVAEVRATTDTNFDSNADLVMEYDSHSGVALNPPNQSKYWGIGIASNNTFDTSNLALQSFDTSAFVNARAIGMADATGDGQDDMLVQLEANDGTVHWRVYISGGTDLGASIEAFTLPGGNDARAVAFTDVDGDGHADILIQQQIEGLVSYQLSLGTGSSYSPRVEFLNFDPQSGRPEILALKDVNGDGTADLVFDRKTNEQHCYFVRAFKAGAFEKQSLSGQCLHSIIGPSADQTIVGVADLNGDGRAELVFQSAATNKSFYYWGYFSLVDGLSGSEWGEGKSLAFESTFSGETFATVAVADINKDGRADLLIEKSDNYLSVKTWQVYLASAYGTFERQDWLTGTPNDKTLGVRDFDGDGLLDLLIERTETVNGVPTSQFYVKRNDGTSFSNALPWTVWHSDTGLPKIVGLEESGLTSLADNNTALVSWVGMSNTLQYTPNEFKQVLLSKGLVLVTSDLPLKDDECKMQWASPETTGPAAGMGSLVCKKLEFGRASIKIQAIYGGCGEFESDVPIGLLPVNGICAAAVYEGTLEVDLGKGVTIELAAEGLTAEACNTVSFSGGPNCIAANATLAGVSQKFLINKTGVGGGLSVGVGLNGSLKTEDGVISGEIGAAALIGLSVEFSVNYGAIGEPVGDFFVKLGETGYSYVGNDAKNGIVAAGGAVYSAAVKLSKIYLSGRELQKTLVTDGVYIAVDGVKAVAVVFSDLLKEPVKDTIKGIETGLKAIGGAAKFVGKQVIDIGKGLGSGASAIAGWAGDLFS